MGRAIFADGVGTVIATSIGGSPTTTYAENIGVMAATRVYSTAAYYCAAAVAIIFGLSPKFGALVSATPGGVLGGITVVLYGMIGLLGAKIWIENRVDFGNPVNLVPMAAGIIIAIGDTKLVFTDTFTLSGIALGTIVTIGAYHMARALAPREMRDRADGAVIALGDVEATGAPDDIPGHHVPHHGAPQGGAPRARRRATQPGGLTSQGVPDQPPVGRASTFARPTCCSPVVVGKTCQQPTPTAVRPPLSTPPFGKAGSAR